jgi:RNA polymerase sigma-70 factor, ECF subfamily
MLMDPIEQALQQALVVRCQLGDRQALEQLFLRHDRALGYYLGRMLARDNVADVQQEVWLTVIRRIGQLRNPAAFVVWLYQIARNCAVDRRTDRRIESLDEQDAALGVVEESEPEFSPADAERIHRHLAQLNPKHREVLVLRFIEDLSYDEIAEVVGCTTGTIRSRLHYAKAALRRELSVESQPY